MLVPSLVSGADEKWEVILNGDAEEDAERLLRRTEKRAFAAFKKAASLADSTPPSLPLPLRIEPKPKSGIRQQDLLKKIVEVKPKKPKNWSPEPTQISQSSSVLSQPSPAIAIATAEHCTAELSSSKPPPQASSLHEKSSSAMKDSLVACRPIREATDSGMENPVKSLLGIAYDSSDED